MPPSGEFSSDFPSAANGTIDNWTISLKSRNQQRFGCQANGQW